MYLDKPTCHEVNPIFNFGETRWQDRNGLEHCSYCGSLNPKEIVKLAEEKQITSISQADWKYGYPHKFYVRGNGFYLKFYTSHLHELIDEPEFDKVAEVLKGAGVSFEKREEELYYKCIK